MRTIRAPMCVAAAALAVAAWAQTGEWQRLTHEAANLRQAGRFAEAAAVLQEAVRVAGQTGQDAAHAACARNNLGVIYDELGRSCEAEHEYRRALALLERAGGSKTSNYAIGLAALAAHYADLGRMAEAERQLRESIAIFTSSMQTSNVGLATARDALAVVMARTGRYREAESLEIQAVEGFEKQPAEAERLGIALNNLGSLRRQQGRNLEAAKLFRQALAIVERALGTDHPRLLTVLNNLAVAESGTGGGDEADAVFCRALTIAQSRLGPAHPTYGRILVNYAGFLRERGEKSRAKRLEAEGRAVLTEFARRQGTALTVDVSALGRPSR